MKRFIFLFSIVLFLSSCWKNDKATPPRELPSRVGFVERVPVKWDTGYREVKGHYENGKWIPKHFVKDSVMVSEWATVPIKEFEVVPNGKQVMKYANLSGYQNQALISGVIIFIVVIVIIVSAGYYTKGSATLLVYGLAILLGIAAALLTLNPANIASNNANTITEKQLKHYESVDQDLNYFWDSVYQKGGIVK
jgi:hypothetical protein